MNTLQANYQAVIEHVATDIEKLQNSGQPNDTANLKLLQKRHEWLISRMDKLNGQRNRIISETNNRLDAYLFQCERFWKARHERTYEKKLQQLDEAKRRVIHIHTLTGFDACYALMLTLKHLRCVLPLPQYAEHAPALEALEHIKKDCYEQLRTYIKI